MPDAIARELTKVKEEQRNASVIRKKTGAKGHCDEDAGYVFTNNEGKLIPPDYVSHFFKKTLIANNLPEIRFHDLRHSTAGYLLSLGFNLKEIQVWLGHSDIHTTMNLYAHVDIMAKWNVADTLNYKLYNSNKSLTAT